MLTVDGLRAFGANVEEGLGRCLNNEAFYLRLVKLGAADRNFTRLEEAMAANDLKAGFEAAHALKGVLSNLALSPLTKPVSELTELLRAGVEADYAPYLNEIARKRDELRALCE